MRALQICIAAGIVFLLMYVGASRGASDAGLKIPFSTRTGIATIIGLGLEERLGPFAISRSGSTTTYSNGGYSIQITETAAAEGSVLRVTARKVSGEPFRLSNFGISARVPRQAIQGVWYPGAEPSATNAMVTDAGRTVEDFSDANYGIPYIAGASSNLKNALAMGFGTQDLSVAITGQPVDRTFYELRLKALMPRNTTALDESFYVSNNPSVSWFEAAENYADWVDGLNGYTPFPVSSRAYEPLYDTWYWSGDRVDEQLYLDTARLAAETGMGMYLADSGWDTASGEYEKWLNGRTGDYFPPQSKFRNLPATFAAIRNENKLGINLWLQPFAVGRRSFRYPVTRNLHVQIPADLDSALGWLGLTYAPFAIPLGDNLETVNICPRMNATQSYLRNLITEMSFRYRPDSFWIDFLDGISTQCIAPHTHDYATFGEGFRKSLETIKNAVLSTNPAAVVHFRARYANLNTKSYANVWQTGDAPGDFDAMRIGSIRLRPFSKGIVFASDQMYWREDIGDVQTAKFIMTSVMSGVPAFGLNLIWAPPATIDMLKAWLRFYRSYQTDLSTGRFSPFGQLRMPNHKIEGAYRTFAYIRTLNMAEVHAENGTIFLLNATDADHFKGKVRGPEALATYSVRVFDRFLGAEPHDMTVTADSTGVIHLNIAVEQGGMIMLDTVLNENADGSVSHR